MDDKVDPSATTSHSQSDSDVLESENQEKEKSLEMLEKLANDYSAYLEVDATKEKTKFGDTIEDMLTKLDEFGSLVDMIRSDSTLCLKTTLPKIQSKQAELQAVFDKIDRLEAFVSVVRENTAIMEECVNKAEDEMGSFSGLKKMLSSFVSPKRSQTKDSKTVSYTAPNIFRTEDYFPKQCKAEGKPGETTSTSKLEGNIKTPEISTSS